MNTPDHRLLADVGAPKAAKAIPFLLAEVAGEPASTFPNGLGSFDEGRRTSGPFTIATRPRYTSTRDIASVGKRGSRSRVRRSRKAATYVPVHPADRLTRSSTLPR